MAQLYDVILTGYPADKKISIIKAIREITGMGLTEAKACSESLPAKIAEAREHSYALAINRKLNEAGGQVSIFEVGTSIAALDQQSEIAREPFFDVIIEPGYPAEKKIHLIKLIRETTSLGLAEAKHYSENLPRTVARDVDYYRAGEIKRHFEQIGTKIRIVPTQAIPHAAEYTSTDTTENYEVVLEAGYEIQFKIGLIKVVREITGIGLADAKTLVESLPKLVKSGISHPHAKEIREKLEQARGRVTIRQIGSSSPVAPLEPPRQVKQTLFSVTLLSIPAEWYYAAINVVREITGLSLVDSGDFVDSCPKVIYEGPDQTKAQQTFERLTKARLDARLDVG